MAKNSKEPTDAKNCDGWAKRLHESRRQDRVELYIPAPPKSDKHQSYKYHLATRNFFAFIFRRSIVGEHLGTALITLMHSIYEFRTADADNVRDLISYLDEVSGLSFRVFI